MPKVEQEEYETLHPLTGVMGQLLPGKLEQRPIWVRENQRHRHALGILGKCVVLSFPRGESNVEDTDFRFDTLAQMKADGLLPKRWILLEDYTLHKTASYQARIRYIHRMREFQPERVFFVTKSSLWRINIKAGVVLARHPSPGEIFDTLEQAIHAAESILGVSLLQSAGPGHIVENDFRFECKVPIPGIIVARYHGIATPEVVPKLLSVYKATVHEMCTNDPTYVSVHDFTSLHSAGFRTLLAFFKGLFPGKRPRSPIQTLVIGKGATVRMGMSMGKVFFDHPVVVVDTMEDAIAIAENSMRARLPGKKGSRNDAPALDARQKVLAQALYMLEAVRWDEPGLHNLESVPESSPLRPLARTLAVIKANMDGVLSKRHKELQQLQDAERRALALKEETELALESSQKNRQTLLQLARHNMDTVREISRTQTEILEVLAGLLDARAHVAVGSTVAIARTARIIALRQGMGEDLAQQVMNGMILRDIGLLAVPDHLLAKDEPTEVELEQIRQHPRIAASVLGRLEGRGMELATEIALCHQECWDGSGYPRGLRGEEIPVVGRLAALAEMHHHLDDPQLLRNYSGTRLDPTLVENWLSHLQER